MNIVFRIDVDNETGMGHYIRMMALADALRKWNCTITFYTIKDEPINYENYDIVILDTYLVNSKYIFDLRKFKCLLVCCDDNALYTYDCDILLNANFYASELEFEFNGNKPILLLGTKYALLRQEFWTLNPINIKKNANHIFLCFGGSDVNNFTPFAIRALRKIKGVKLTVVLGAYTQFDVDVFNMKSKNIIVKKNPNYISNVMRDCDIAITGAGSMVYELAALGIPSIVVPQADNQYNIAEYLEKNKLMRRLNNWNSISDDELREQTFSLLLNPLRRKDESYRLVNTVDRKGAVNVARAIMEVANEYFK